MPVSASPSLSSILALVLFTTLIGGCAPDSTSNGDAPTSHPAALALDGAFDEWNSIPELVRDSIGDGGETDVQSLSMAHDDEYLFVSFRLNAALTLQQDNDLTLALDLDADESTGNADGADLTWTFGERNGTYYGPSTTELGHADLGFASLPTVSSNQYEIALRRAATPGQSEWLTTGDTVCAVLESQTDRAPDTGRVCYKLTEGPSNVNDGPVELERAPETQVRVISHNVLQDTLFTAPVRNAYERIYRTVEPDVYALQEIYDHEAEVTRTRIAELTDTDATEWHTAKLGLDLVVVSRFPILGTHTIPGFEDYESGAYLLDTNQEMGHPLLLINMHPPCCTGGEPTSDLKRQRVVDAVVAFLRDTHEDGGPLDVPTDTPILIVGDMNFVGDAQQPASLADGGILNTSLFGDASAPDWDGSPLLDINPSQTGAPLHTTWENADSSFPPGRLDYAYLSDSVAEVKRAYTLSTSQLPDSVRTAYGLKKEDTARASDHLPLVIDISSDD
ncbi:endonuclease/exonuclease/phosphatase family protein [Longibacter salinarum]|nr:endonuclease/exonuclease/phosphatase family protein [Longibacter salinarum]